MEGSPYSLETMKTHTLLTKNLSMLNCCPVLTEYVTIFYYFADNAVKANFFETKYWKISRSEQSLWWLIKGHIAWDESHIA